MSQTQEEKERQKKRHEVNRSAQYFSLLIAAIGVLNGFIFYERRSILSFLLVVIAAAALVGWIWYSRRVLKSL